MKTWWKHGLVAIIFLSFTLWLKDRLSDKEGTWWPDSREDSYTGPVNNHRNVSDNGTFMPNTLRDGFPSSDPNMPAPVTATAPADGSWSDPANIPTDGVYYPKYHRNGAMELQYMLRNGTRGVIPIMETNEAFVFIPTNTVSFRVRNPEGKTLAQLTHEDAEKQKLLHPSTAPTDDPWPLPQRELTLIFTDIPPVWPATK